LPFIACKYKIIEYSDYIVDKITIKLLNYFYTMREDSNEEITKKIDDGSYFKDALDWYNKKYLFPIIERSYVFVLSIFIILAFLLVANSLYNIFPITRQFSFPIYVDNSTEYITMMRKLSAEGETPQQSIAKHLVNDYILTREEFDARAQAKSYMKRKLKKVKNSSSKSVFNDYRNYLDQIGIFNPALHHSNKQIRKITINSFKFINFETTSGKARIFFESTIKNRNDKKKEMWEAVIKYRMPDIAILADSNAPLRFFVTHYQTTLIK